MLLDEPTNHLDLQTREALSMALNEFEGTVMLVSHDRALLRAVCDEFWLVGRGAVAPFDGDLDDYQRYLLDEARRVRESARASAPECGPTATPESIAQPDPLALASGQKTSNSTATAPDARTQRRESAQKRAQLAEKTRPLRRALEACEAKMSVLGAEKDALEARLATVLVAGDIVEASKRLHEVLAALAQEEERWLDLSTELEALSQAA